MPSVGRAQISGDTGDPKTSKPSNEYSKVVTEYVCYLRGRYQKQIPTVLTLQWPPPPTQKVLHLAMIQGKSTQYGSIDEDMVRLTLQGKIRDILRRKTPIELKDIFQKPREKKRVEIVEQKVETEDTSDEEDKEEEVEEKRKVILIEGAPGAGKSTLAWHICQQWGAGKLFQMFQGVIFIQLRDPAIRFAKSLEDILPAAARNQAEKVAAEFKVCYGKDLLFVMDGWDELPLDLHTNSIFYQLIASPETLNLHFSTVIVTSRPIASGDLYRYRTISSRIEILGFTPTEVEGYFTEALKGDSKAVQKMQNQLRERPMIEASCYLPLNAAIVTHLFLAYDHTLPTTLHGVFTSLVLCCLIRHMTKLGESIPDDISSLDDLPPRLQETLKNISTLAYHGIMKNKVTFSAIDLKELKLPRKLGTLGLMQGAESFTSLKSSVTYNFLHLSVQELLASLHISRLPEDEEIKTFIKLFGKPRFASVFQFYAAFTKLETEGIRKIVGDIAKRKEKNQLLYLLHGLYEAQNLSLCQFVGCQLGVELGLSSSTLSPVDSLTIGYFISCICCTESGAFYANLCNCSLDDHRVGFLVKELCRYSSSVGMNTPNIATKDAGVSSSFELYLNLSENQITSDGAQALGELVKVNHRLRILDLSHNKVTDGAHTLGEALKLNQSLRTLNLEENKITDDGAQALADALKVNQSLTTLNLKENQITDDGLQALGEALKVNQSLTTLILWNNRIADDGAEALGEALKVNQSLRILDLTENEITDDGVQALGEALKLNQSLTALSLQWNGIGNSGTAAIAKGLQQNESLKELDLYHNQITDEGVKAIGEALSINQSLTTLDLRTNQIADEGANALGEALKVNESLITLDLQYNHISDKGARALDEALRVNQSLKTVRLWNRFISSEMEESLLRKFQGRVDFG